jgi:hypothetical protein
MQKTKATWFHGFALLLVVVVLWALQFAIGKALTPTAVWFVTFVALFLFALIAGHWVTGVWRGVFINERNRISLSQTQIVLWTILVLTTLFAGALFNLASADAEPLKIAVPKELWILMGISTTSLVGSPLLSGRKKAQSATVEEEAAAMDRLADKGRDAASLNTVGRLLANDVPTDARWSDLFESEEVTRAGQSDVTKIQMTFFTLVIAVVYGNALAGDVGAPGAAGFHDFPAISDSMIALLGISHAGYLAGKVVPEREDLR